MKKYIPIAVLSLALVGCTNSNAPAGEVNSQIEEENKDDQKKVIEVSKPEESEEESEDKNSEENASEDTDKSKKVDKDINDKEEDEKEKVDDKEEKKEEKPSEEKESDNEEKQSKVNADDLFFLPYGPFASVNENGELVDENGKELVPNQPTNSYEYVKYTNNVFVKMKNDLYGTVSIVRMNDKDVSTLYEFPEGEEFTSLGMIGDKIYGFHSYKSKSDINGTPSLKTDKTAIGYVDLASGEVHDYEDTIDVQTGEAVVIDGQLQFTKAGDNAKENVYNYDLYKLDLTKGLDQKAELVEKDFDLQYLFGQKRFVDGKPVWDILRADNDNIYANDQKFPFLWAEAGYQEIIGNNIFYFPANQSDTRDVDLLSRTLKVMNLTSGETVLEETVRGIKIADGKLYYLTSNNQLESVDIEL
ncbi:hypothetical protein [Anaerococcus provencensis]|uniref:hypothetical protein n=1 Tax=Anaerococcus provencensis TaxID=938293 RepID=UPI0002F98E1F|nr:hypothetical protein [Anaerococcus provencensis]